MCIRDSDTAAGGSDNLDLHAGGFEQDDFAGQRDAALDFADQAAEGRGFVGLVEIAQAVLLAEEIGQLVDGKAAGDQPDAAGLALRIFNGYIHLMLVADVAHLSLIHI